jgi:hypothetical protein
VKTLKNILERLNPSRVFLGNFVGLLPTLANFCNHAFSSKLATMVFGISLKFNALILGKITTSTYKLMNNYAVARKLQRMGTLAEFNPH